MNYSNKKKANLIGLKVIIEIYTTVCHKECWIQTDSMVCQNILSFIDFYMLFMLLIYSIFVTYSCIYFNDCFYIQIETLRLIKKLFNLISKLF